MRLNLVDTRMPVERLVLDPRTRTEFGGRCDKIFIGRVRMDVARSIEGMHVVRSAILPDDRIRSSVSRRSVIKETHLYNLAGLGANKWDDGTEEECSAEAW